MACDLGKQNLGKFKEWIFVRSTSYTAKLRASASSILSLGNIVFILAYSLPYFLINLFTISEWYSI